MGNAVEGNCPGAVHTCDFAVTQMAIKKKVPKATRIGRLTVKDRIDCEIA